MKKYPNRESRSFNKFNIFSKHVCSDACSYKLIINNEGELYITKNDNCDLNNKYVKSLIKLDNFSKDKCNTVDGKLLNHNSKIKIKDYEIIIDYPLYNVSTFKVMKKEEINFNDFIELLSLLYKDIYEREEETSSPIEYTYVTPCNDCGVSNIINHIHDNSVNDIDNINCVICLENNNNSIIKLNCNHTIHTTCLENWIKKFKNTCPICRDIIYKCKACDGKMEKDRLR